jgi:hypothetical protein
MAWGSLFGRTDRLSKASGKREERMGTGSGDLKRVITMKAIGRTTIKVERAAIIMLATPFTEATFSTLSRTATARRSSPTRINTLANIA